MMRTPKTIESILGQVPGVYEGLYERSKKMNESRKRNNEILGSNGPMRMNAHNVLKSNIKKAERRLESLQTLERSIDWDNLNDKDDESLWSLLCTRGEL